MRFKIDRTAIVKLLVIGAILTIAPYALPFSIELVLMADIIGLEALIIFLIYQSRHALTALIARFTEWRSHAAATALALANVYVFQPKIFISHAAASSFILLFACSMVFALALWIPAIYLSGGVIT